MSALDAGQHVREPKDGDDTHEGNELEQPSLRGFVR